MPAMAGPPRPRRDRPAIRAHDRWILLVLIVSITFVTFLPTLGNDFVTWDDDDNLTENPLYRGLGWSELRWMWTTILMGHYIPLTWMTFGLDYLVWGMNPAGYHLTNVVLHAANAALFYVLVQRLLTIALHATFADAFALRLASAFAALLFAVHPLRVESVAWATERRDVLCGFFVLASLLAYLHHATAPEAESPRRWYWISLGLFVAAVLSKEMAITLPAVLVILDWYPLERLGAGSRTAREPTASGLPGVSRVLAEKIPFVLVAAVSSAVVVLANVRVNLSSFGELGLLERAAVSVHGLGFYLWKTVAPVHLAALYELRRPVEVASLPVVLSAVVVAAITALAVLGRTRWPGLGAAWLASVMLFAPVIGIVHNGPQLAADRYTYLPTLPWAVLAGAALALLIRASGPSRRLAARLALPACAIAVLAVLAAAQTRTWANSERLWTHTASTAPSSVAYYNLGALSERQGRWDEAIDYYRQALRLKPGYPEAHYNWGVILARQQRPTEAIEHYREALRIKPDHAEAHYNWGLVASAAGRDDEAIEHYRLALQAKPQLAAAHNNWGNILVRQGHWSSAVDHYREALRLKPDYAEAHNNIASAFARQERWDEAISHYRKALEIRPDFGPARENLERLLSRPESRALSRSGS
jgi:protein O-mannosyl-transferase